MLKSLHFEYTGSQIYHKHHPDIHIMCGKYTLLTVGSKLFHLKCSSKYIEIIICQLYSSYSTVYVSSFLFYS